MDDLLAALAADDPAAALNALPADITVDCDPRQRWWIYGTTDLGRALCDNRRIFAPGRHTAESIVDGMQEHARRAGAPGVSVLWPWIEEEDDG